jgi:hypothetical protein
MPQNPHRNRWAAGGFPGAEVKTMRKTLLGLAALAAVTLAAPRSADAYVSVSVGLPGLFFGIGAPVYAPPVYAPPVYAPRVYAPYPVYAPYYRPYVRYGGYYRNYYRRPYYRRHYRHY